MTDTALILKGEGLTIRDAMAVARHGRAVAVSEAAEVQQRVRDSHAFIVQAVADNQPIYGVTSGFGAMAYKTISREQAVELQNNIP